MSAPNVWWITEKGREVLDLYKKHGPNFDPNMSWERRQINAERRRGYAELRASGMPAKEARAHR